MVNNILVITLVAKENRDEFRIQSTICNEAFL